MFREFVILSSVPPTEPCNRPGWKGCLKFIHRNLLLKTSQTSKTDWVAQGLGLSSFENLQSSNSLTSLGSLLWCLPPFWWKMLHLSLTGCSPDVSSCYYLLALHSSSLTRVWLCLLNNYLTCQGAVGAKGLGAPYVSHHAASHPLTPSEGGGQAGAARGRPLSRSPAVLRLI